METVRIVCAHDCPDMCSLLAEVEDGRVKRIKGDPDEPFTAGFACAKVNRDAELVHSPERLATPLRRTGLKGEGKFAPISWDAALDEIVARWRSIIAESGPQALLGYAYSAHQGQINRGLLLGLFHALGTSRLIAGTVCDTCCEEAWNMTVGPIGGADPEAVDEADLIISWGADLVATNVHFWAKVEAAQKRGVKLVVIDPRRGHRARRSGHRALCRDVWCRQMLVRPARRRHDAPRARRRGAARGGVAARSDRRLREARRRRPPDDRGFVRIELRRAAQALRA